jgi:hypothetical protein
MPETDELIVYLETQIDACQSHWQNVLKNIQGKLGPLTEAISGMREVLTGTAPDKDSAMCEQLTQYLITGETAEALAHFLSKEIYDCKIIPKLDDVRFFV